MKDEDLDLEELDQRSIVDLGLSILRGLGSSKPIEDLEEEAPYRLEELERACLHRWNLTLVQLDDFLGQVKRAEKRERFSVHKGGIKK